MSSRLHAARRRRKNTSRKQRTKKLKSERREQRERKEKAEKKKIGDDFSCCATWKIFLLHRNLFFFHLFSFFHHAVIVLQLSVSLTYSLALTRWDYVWCAITSTQHRTRLTHFLRPFSPFSFVEFLLIFTNSRLMYFVFRSTVRQFVALHGKVLGSEGSPCNSRDLRCYCGFSSDFVCTSWAFLSDFMRWAHH